MRTIATLSLACILAAAATAQCTPAIPANAVVYSQASGAGNYAAQSIWVCGGAGLAANGSNNHYYMEDGAIVSFGGTGNFVYSKGAVIYIAGNNNIVYYQGSAANITDGGTGNTITPCTTMVFDYTNAPASGCAVGIDEHAAAIGLKLYPNPVMGALTVEMSGDLLKEVRVMDMQGREVMDLMGSGIISIDMSRLSAGPYVLRLLTEQGEVRRVVMKN
jgi:hypothetical protein